MDFVIFTARRFIYFLADVAIWPFQTVRWLWSQPERGRALLFGLPSLLLVIFTVVALSVANFGTHDHLVQRYRVMAERAVDQQQWQQAYLAYSRLVELNPTDNVIKYQLYEVTRQLPDERSMSHSLISTLAPEDRANHSPAHVHRAELLMNDAETQLPPFQRMLLARRHLQLALVADANNEDAQVKLAELDMSLGRIDDAERSLSRLVDRYPRLVFRLVQVYQMRGRSQTEIRGLFRNAVNRYRRMLLDNPNDYALLEGLTHCRMELRDWEPAEADLLRALQDIQEEPLRTRVSHLLSMLYNRWAQSLLAEDPNSEVHADLQLNLLEKALKQNEHNEKTQEYLTIIGLKDNQASERARQIYNPMDNIDGATAQVLKILGTYQLLEGDEEVGIELLEKALIKNPQDPESLNNLAYALMDRDLERALELSNRAVALGRGGPSFLDTRARVFMRRGEFAKAAADLEQALVAAPADVEARVALEYCFRQMGMNQYADLHRRRIEELQQNDAGEATPPG